MEALQHPAINYAAAPHRNLQERNEADFHELVRSYLPPHAREDEYLGSIYDLEAERIASGSWGTANKAAVVAKVPYFIRKARAKHHIGEREMQLALRTLLLLIAYGKESMALYERDGCGLYNKRGVKRTQRDMDYNLSSREPGEGGEYVSFSDYSSDGWEDDEASSHSSDSDMDVLAEQFSRLSLSPPQGSCTDYRTLSRVRSALNGNNGEWTGSDDVKGRGKGQKPKQLRGSANSKKSSLAKNLKPLARSIVKEQLGSLVGPNMAQQMYSSGAKMMRGVREKQLVLSSVATQYLKSFTDPFSGSTMGAHIPRPPATLSFKVTSFIRGSFSLGTRGFGFVALAPCLANDRPGVYFTTVGFGAATDCTQCPVSDLTIFNQIGGGLNYPAWAAFSSMPFSSAQLLNISAGVSGNSNDITGRIVSSSLKVQYQGTVLNRQGMYYGYVDPAMDNVLSVAHTANSASSVGYSLASISAKTATEIAKIGENNSMTLVRTTTDPSFDDYARNNSTNLRKLYPYSGGEYYPVTDSGGAFNDSLLNGVASACVLLNGAAGTPVYFEAVQHLEFIGPGVMQALLTESTSDVVGFDAVKTVLEKAQRLIVSDPKATFSNAVKTVMRKENIKFGSGHRSVDY